MSGIIKTEHAAPINGVAARFYNVVADSKGRILNQSAKASRDYSEHGNKYRITVSLRFDDECRNGHESFAITADISENGREYMGGCCHEEIAKRFPEFASLIKWHLVSTDAPMHYIANTLYWLGFSGWCDGKASSPPNLAHARSTAIWPDLPECYLNPTPTAGGFGLRADDTPLAQTVRKALVARHSGLMAEFKAAMCAIGFVWPEHTSKSADL